MRPEPTLVKSKTNANKLSAQIGLLVVCLVNEPAWSADRYTHVEIADCHVHILDFLQNGDFYEDGAFVVGSVTHQPARPAQRIEALLRMMDHANVTHAMVTGMPFVKKWSTKDPTRSRYYLDSEAEVNFARDTDATIAEAIRDFQTEDGNGERLARIHPFLCGINSTDLGAVDRLIKTIKAFPGIWQGIGEVMSRHDDLTNLTPGESPTADHPALRRVYDFAGSHGLPVSLHHNIGPISSDGAFRDPLYLPELLECFEGHPETTFIWCHAGISRRIVVKDLPGLLDKQVLARHKRHVYIDLSWVVLHDYVLKDLKAWSSLIAKYPENFMVGSDNVGGLQNYVATVRAYDRLFSALGNEELVAKVAGTNFLRLLPANGVTLPADFAYPEEKYVPRRNRARQ